MSISIDFSLALNTKFPIKTFDSKEFVVQNHEKSLFSQGIRQGFTELPYNMNVIYDIQNKIKKFENKFETIVVLGIGGSMLGVQTVLDALYSQNHSNGSITVHCVDNIDPFVIQNLTAKLDFGTTLFLVQTKSGGTPETIAQFLYFKEQAQSLGLLLENHFIFVTDPAKGYLRQLANANENIACIDIPDNVGGRFSVLTPMGLLVLCLLDLDAGAMLRGAKNALENQKELASQLANLQVQLYGQGVDQNVLMPYSSRLATLSKWYIQLLSESIGKEKSLDGQTVNHGITPIPALGATDQHSQAQLFKDGPFNKLVMTMQVQDYQALPVICDEATAGLEYLQGITFGDLMDAELQGTRQSLAESGKPNLNITIDKVCEYTVGELFMFLELSVCYIGNMLNVDTFDQPGVERAKILAKEILSSHI